MAWISGGATISDDGVYRYWLSRCWKDRPPAQALYLDKATVCHFVMLNPSTADAKEDDPTIRRCIGFANRWGFRQLVVTNLFALRATDPAELYKAADPIGPDNDNQILIAAALSHRTVFAWGTHGAFKGRGEAVKKLLMGFNTQHLGLTKDGHPKHPLYLHNETQPQNILV